MADDIKVPVVGETPTMLDAEYAAKVVGAVNALRNLVVSPQGLGSLKIGDENVILDLSPFKKLFDQLSTTVSAFSNTSSTGGGGGDGGGSSAVVNKINEIISALNGMSISGTCDPVTRDITVTLDIDVPEPL